MPLLAVWIMFPIIVDDRIRVISIPFFGEPDGDFTVLPVTTLCRDTDTPDAPSPSALNRVDFTAKILLEIVQRTEASSTVSLSQTFPEINVSVTDPAVFRHRMDAMLAASRLPLMMLLVNATDAREPIFGICIP